MSVTWLDLPGWTLPSRSESIDFVTSTDPVAISVSFGPGRPEERAYRDGAWLYPYLASTRVGDLFALRRTGGWPTDFRVFVDENLALGPGVIVGASDRVVDGSGARVVP